MAYEDGMQVIYDAFSQQGIVSFRGTVTVLGFFSTSKEAVAAGEEYCRERGWEDEIIDGPEPSDLRKH